MTEVTLPALRRALAQCLLLLSNGSTSRVSPSSGLGADRYVSSGSDPVSGTGPLSGFAKGRGLARPQSWQAHGAPRAIAA